MREFLTDLNRPVLSLEPLLLPCRVATFIVYDVSVCIESSLVPCNTMLQADVMIAGGSEASMTPLCFAGFCSMRAMVTTFNDDPGRASRPFDKDRAGFVMGEGAGVLILETEEHALARGATIYCEVLVLFYSALYIGEGVTLWYLARAIQCSIINGIWKGCFVEYRPIYIGIVVHEQSDITHETHNDFVRCCLLSHVRLSQRLPRQPNHDSG